MRASDFRSAPAAQVCAISLTDWQRCGQTRPHCRSFNERHEKSFTHLSASWPPRVQHRRAPMSLFRSRDSDERRKTIRHDLQYLAQIDPADGSAPLSCIISDISLGGAKLTVGPQEVPEEFTLWFRRRCRVVRRSDGQLGVRFVQGG